MEDKWHLLQDSHPCFVSKDRVPWKITNHIYVFPSFLNTPLYPILKTSFQVYVSLDIGCGRAESETLSFPLPPSYHEVNWLTGWHKFLHHQRVAGKLFYFPVLLLSHVLPFPPVCVYAKCTHASCLLHLTSFQHFQRLPSSGQQHTLRGCTPFYLYPNASLLSKSCIWPVNVKHGHIGCLT